jgi:(heptosyl)LPS beta-1,4-glucosyltransferase
LWAEQHKAQHDIAPFWKPMLSAAFRWLRDYILKAGFLDGRAGWDIAMIDASYTFTKYYFTRKGNLNNRQQREPADSKA